MLIPLLILLAIISHVFCVISDESMTFPREYPTGCLLGCVDVTDCLEQSEYRQQVLAFIT